MRGLLTMHRQSSARSWPPQQYFIIWTLTNATATAPPDVTFLFPTLRYCSLRSLPCWHCPREAVSLLNERTPSFLCQSSRHQENQPPPLPPIRMLHGKKTSHGWNYRVVIALQQMKLTRCFSPGIRAMESKKKKGTQNLIKALNLRCIYRCRADFHANLHTQASFTAQLWQNLINRILRGADFCQITWGLHSVSFPAYTHWLHLLATKYLPSLSLEPCQQTQDWVQRARRGHSVTSSQLLRGQGYVSGMLSSSQWPLFQATRRALCSLSILALTLKCSMLFNPYYQVGTLISILLLNESDLREVK